MLHEIRNEDDELEQWQIEMRLNHAEDRCEDVRPEPLELVSVVFGTGCRVYDYICVKDSFQVGDIGVAPPSAFFPKSQEVRVVGVKPISEKRPDIRYKWLTTPDRDRAGLIEMEPLQTDDNE